MKVRTDTLNVVLAAIAVIAGAALAAILTLPLLAGSIVTFALVAGGCWCAVFGAAVCLTRHLTRSERASQTLSSQPRDARTGEESSLPDPSPACVYDGARLGRVELATPRRSRPRSGRAGGPLRAAQRSDGLQPGDEEASRPTVEEPDAGRGER